MSGVKPYVAGQTGSLSDVIERGPELAPFTPAGPGGFAPDPTWPQMFRAARPAALRSTPLYDETKIGEGYAPIVDALGLPASENPGFFGDLDAAGVARFGNSGERPSGLATAAQQGSIVPFSSGRLADRTLQESLIVDQIKARRAKDPNWGPGVPDTVDGLHSYFEQQQAAKRAAGAAVLARGSTFGRVTASLAAGGLESATNDPTFLPSMVLGGGTATSLVQAVGRDALINGVLAAAQLPQQAVNMAENDEHLTVSDAVSQVVTAAAIGAGAGATIHLGATHVPPALFRVMPESAQTRWAGRMKVGENGPLLRDVLGDMDNRELSGFARSTIGTRMTPDEKAAANVLERSQELGEASPFAPGPAGDAAHNANLAVSLKSIIDGAPAGRVDLLSTTSAVGLRPPRPIAMPLDAGFEGQWRAIVGNEGGTGPHGEFLTSPKGAVGPAQVMPGTAPYAAKLAGLPWDEARYRGDALYNDALGRAYYAEQLRTFGDPDMAAAAYNAGPGSTARGTGLRGALKRAAEHGEPGNWEAYLPHETQRYVEDFRRRAGTGAAEGEPGIAAGDVAGEAADAEALALSRERERNAMDAQRETADVADVPLLKRDLFGSDEQWADAQAAFHQSLNGPEELAGGPLASEAPSGPPELAAAQPARAAAGSQSLEQWFGGSLIADERGRPLTVYHGSGSQFDTFDVAKAGYGRGSTGEQALFFSTDPEVASHSALVAGAGHATGEPTHMGVLSDNGGVVYPVHLHLENPLISKLKFYNGEEFAKEIARAKAAGRDGVIFPHVNSRGENGTIAVFHPDQVRSIFADAANVRVDEPALKSFEPGATGPKDQLTSLEHDYRMAAADPARAARSYEIDGKPITLVELLDEFDRDRAAAAALRACAGGGV